MKAMFNAVCHRCGDLKPRCAKIIFKDGPFQERNGERIYCADCRKELHPRAYTLHPQHKAAAGV